MLLSKNICRFLLLIMFAGKLFCTNPEGIIKQVPLNNYNEQFNHLNLKEMIFSFIRDGERAKLENLLKKIEYIEYNIVILNEALREVARYSEPNIDAIFYLIDLPGPLIDRFSVEEIIFSFIRDQKLKALARIFKKIEYDKATFLKKGLIRAAQYSQPRTISYLLNELNNTTDNLSDNNFLPLLIAIENGDINSVIGNYYTYIKTFGYGHLPPRLANYVFKFLHDHSAILSEQGTMYVLHDLRMNEVVHPNLVHYFRL